MTNYSNINNWMDVMRLTEKKPPLPILSFPAVQLLYVTTNELVQSSTLQALGIKMIADKFNLPAALGYMDLSVEAEAFGAHAVYSVDEIPTIIGQLIKSEEDANNLKVPEIGAGRTKKVIDGIAKARKIIRDKPIFAECVGPFSLAGRLMDVNEAMVNCYDEPEMVHILLKKSTEFIIKYIQEFKNVGADGVILAEPLAGVLSPNIAQEFSHQYVKEIIDEVQDENFVVIYHNCGNGVTFQLDDIYNLGCKAYHFGDSVNMKEILEKTPEDIIVMGNVSPAKAFIAGKPQIVASATYYLLTECRNHKNFWVSSGCDIPPLTDFENIEAFFRVADEFYYIRDLIREMNAK